MNNICLKCGGLLWDDGSGPLSAIKRFCSCKVEPITTPLMYGWICPRCFKVHSPWSTVCDCVPNTISYSTIPKSETAYKISDFKPGEFDPPKGNTGT